MRPEEHMESLIREIGKRSGLNLAMENGVCGLALRSGAKVAIALAAGDADAIWLYAPVAALGPANRTEVMERAMRLNFFGDGLGGAWLALAEDGDSLMLCYARILSGLDGDTLLDLIVNFGDAALAVGAALSDAGNAGAPPPAPHGMPFQGMYA